MKVIIVIFILYFLSGKGERRWVYSKLYSNLMVIFIILVWVFFPLNRYMYYYINTSPSSSKWSSSCFFFPSPPSGERSLEKCAYLLFGQGTISVQWLLAIIVAQTGGSKFHCLSWGDKDQLVCLSASTL